MGKRKRRTAEPTLFDLPLHTSGEADVAEDAEDSGAGRGPSILFDRDESQLDQLELGPGAGEEPAADAPAGELPIVGARAEPPAAGARAAKPPAAEAPAAKRPATEAPAAEPPADETAAEPASEEAATSRGQGASEKSASSSEPAYLGDRLLGGLADLAAQMIALGLAVAAVHALDVVVTTADWMPFGVLAVVFSFLYWCVPLAFWGRTPGMAWVGHTARATSGEPLSFGQTFLRWLGAIVTLGLAGLPLLLALTGRSLTDRVSGSQTRGTGR